MALIGDATTETRPPEGILRFSAELRRSLAEKIEPDLFDDAPLVRSA